MAKSGGARVIPQSRFTPVELGKQMQKLGLAPAALANAAGRAASVGHPLATQKLADLVERIGDDGSEVIPVQQDVRAKIRRPIGDGVPA